MLRTHLRLWALIITSLAALGPSSWAADCNQNGVDDVSDIGSGASLDCNANVVPDECELGPGALAFEQHLEYLTGAGPAFVTAADLDGDGRADLAVANRGAGAPGSVSWLRQQPDGSFDAPQHLASGDGTGRIVADDLDGDSDIDLVALNYDSDDVAVLQNQGGGVFSDAVRTPTAHFPRRLLAGDLDGDGDTDFVTTNRLSRTISVLMNQGGALAPAQNFSTVDGPRGGVLGDLDGDGDLDVATANGGDWESQTRTVSVLFNLGQGGFDTVMTHAVGTFPLSIVAADINGDSRLDLATANATSADVSLLFGLAGGGFSPERRIPANRQPEELAAADMDADADIDLVVTGIYPESATEKSGTDIALLTNTGNGTFGAPFISTAGGHLLCLGDLNGDELPEVVTTSSRAMHLAVFPNRGNGALGEPVGTRTGIGAVFIDAVDLDQDHDLDLISANIGTGSVSVIYNQTQQAFERGCGEFLRGDGNVDGFVSISDALMLRRYLYVGNTLLPCLDGADVIDDESVDGCDGIAIFDAIFENPGWSIPLAAPFPGRGHDENPLGISHRQHGCPDIYIGGDGLPTLPTFGCLEYNIVPPSPSSDLVRLGDAVAVPGGEARVPVYLSNVVPMEALQLVIQYDPSQVEIPSGRDSLSWEGSYFEQFFNRTVTVADPNSSHPHTVMFYGSPGIGELITVPELATLVVAMGGHWLVAGLEVPPGENTLLGWIKVRVLPSAEPGATLSLLPTNGPDGQGVGPYRLRNEISSQGTARLVSTLPRLGAALISIVGDQSFFRGDSNSDDAVNISDPIHTLAWLFLGEGRLERMDAADANDDGKVDLSDAVFTLGALFTGDAVLPPPAAAKGDDPTEDGLHCYRLARS